MYNKPLLTSLLFLKSQYLAKSKEEKAFKHKQLSLKQEVKDCTFHPQTHYSSHYKQKQNLSVLNTSIKERQSTWEGIKVAKIERIANYKEMKDKTECKFTPNITRSESYLTTKTLPTENIVLDPESFKYYLKKRQKLRMDRIQLLHKRENTPGNGKVWKNKQTVVQEFSFETEKRIGRKRGSSQFNIPMSQSKKSVIKKTNSYILIRNSSNKECEAGTTQYTTAKERLHSELFKCKL